MAVAILPVSPKSMRFLKLASTRLIRCPFCHDNIKAGLLIADTGAA